MMEDDVKKKLITLCSLFLIGLAVQSAGYLYLDQVLFAPLDKADYDVSDVKDKETDMDKAGKNLFSKINLKGKAYYSHDYHYMADVSENAVTIYNSDNLSNPQRVDLKDQGVSFFEWMPDRNLALMALYPLHFRGGRWDVTLARYNPEGTTHESDAPINDLPRNSKIVDVAYSTATNAVYMKMEVSPGLYRLYRTDANYDTRRIYVQTSHIGKIAVYYDEDRLFYDDTERGIIYTFNGDDSSWRVISPPGDYRLVGLGSDKVIYAAKMNSKGEVIGYYAGRLGVGFEQVKDLQTPVEFNSVTSHLIAETAKAEGIEIPEARKKE